jgi:8-oxo-dGTP pyrophosphatase MutT (NUDIX family)
MIDFNDSDMKWKVVKSENIIHRPGLDVYCSQVELPDGTVHDEFYKLHNAAFVCIVAETKDGQIIMERQYRHAVDDVLTEIPAGVVEEGEEPLVAAKRELLEETGFAGGEWKPLLVEYPQPGIQDNKMYSFYAKGVEKVDGQKLDKTEDIHVHLIEQHDVFQMLLNGEFMSAPTSAPLWKYFALYTEQLLIKDNMEKWKSMVWQ